MDRLILLCDANSFYASVETLLDSSLRGHPVAVAGNPESRHGVVVARNELARRFGVRTTDTVQEAKRKCPDLLLVAPHREEYVRVSGMLNRIYLDLSDLVDPYSIDESYIDLTGSALRESQNPRRIADDIRRRAREEVGVTVSVGVSFNRCFAKLASDMKKPDGTTVIMREDMERVIWPMDAGSLLYVGGSTVKKLRSLGITTVGQLAASSREAMVAAFGKHGDQIWRYANGLDDEPVRSYYEPRPVKSIGNGFTFRRDLVGREEIKEGVSYLADSVAMRLRSHALRCRTVQVQIKDPGFKTISRQMTLPRPTLLWQDITDASMELIEKNWDMKSPIRLITITCQDLVPMDEDNVQLSFFDAGGTEKAEKREKLEQMVANIRQKHGKGSITYGYGKNEELGIGRKPGK